MIGRRYGSGAPQFYLTDHLGSATTLLNSSGGKSADMRYDPWGEERWVETALPHRFRFTGQRYDDALDLYDYQARYYDPSTGRFISADSIIPDPTDPQSFNRYSYVNNKPLILIDPSGHSFVAGDCVECASGRSGPPSAPPLPLQPPTKPLEITGKEFSSGHPGVDYNDQKDLNIYASANGVVRVSDTCGLDDCEGLGGERRWDPIIKKFLETDEEYAARVAKRESEAANYGLGNVVIVEYRYDVIPPKLRMQLGLSPNESLYFEYAHLANDSLPTVESEVQRGDVIGQIGNTGNSYTAHLHFEARIGVSGALANDSYQNNWQAWDGMERVPPRTIFPLPRE